MDVAADESQTHSQFITESMASNRDELRVAALKELQQRALDKWVAQNGTSAGVQNYKLYKSISQELAETEQGLDGGYLYPMLRGPARGKHLVLEDLPNAAQKFDRRPPRIIKASPVLDSKIKIARRLRPDSNVYTYCKSSGANEYSGKGIFRRMGPHTLIGSVATEAGGTVPVYMCSAWAGPMDAGGSLVQDAEKIVKTAFSRVLEFMCTILNSENLGDHAAAGVRYYHSLQPREEHLLLCPRRHATQDAQAFTTWSSAALEGIHRCWSDPNMIQNYCDTLRRRTVPEDAIVYFRRCAQHVRFVLTAHLRRHGLDLHGGFFIPADRQQTVLGDRVSCLQRVLLESRRLLDSLFFSSGTSTSSLRRPQAAAWIREAEAETTVLLSLAVEFSIVSPRAADETGCSCDQSFPRFYNCRVVNGVEVLCETDIGVAHHQNWGMMRSNTGGAGGLTARNIKLPEDGSLDGEFDIGGGLSTLADEVLAAVTAVDPAAGAEALEAAAQVAFNGPPAVARTRSASRAAAPGRNNRYVGTLRSLVPPIGNNPIGLSVYEGGRRRELGSGGELLGSCVFKDLTEFTNALASTTLEKTAGADVVLSGMVRRVAQVCGVDSNAPSLRVEVTVELSPTESSELETTLVDRLMELVKETYARLLLLEPSEFTKVSPTAAIAFIWTRMAEEVKHYLFSMLEEEVNSSGSVHPLWAALAAGFLGNLNLSVSSWVHGHDLTELAIKYLSVAARRACETNFMSYIPSLLSGLDMVKISSVQGGVVDLHGAMTSISTFNTKLAFAPSSSIPRPVEPFRGLTLCRSLLDFAVPMIFGSLQYSDHPGIIRSLLIMVNTLAVARVSTLATKGKIELLRDTTSKYSNVSSGYLRSLRIEERGRPPLYLVGGARLDPSSPPPGAPSPPPPPSREEAFFTAATWGWLEDEAKAQGQEGSFDWYRRPRQRQRTEQTMSLEDYVELIVQRVLAMHRSLRDAVPDTTPEVPDYSVAAAAAAEEEEEEEPVIEEEVPDPPPVGPAGRVDRKTIRSRTPAPDLDVLLPYFDYLLAHMQRIHVPSAEACTLEIFRAVSALSIPNSNSYAVAGLLMPLGLWKTRKLQVAKLVGVAESHTLHFEVLSRWDETYKQYRHLEAGLMDTPEQLAKFLVLEEARGNDRHERLLGLVMGFYYFE
ncbi:hypothetical protein Ndes2437A_g09152 [Nannochloris sp. 'desiccata']